MRARPATKSWSSACSRLQRENLDLVVKNRTLSEVSSRDSLTGLYNRWFVIEKIDSEMNRALRHGSPMSLLMLDIDHFKRVNDTWGHGAGDQVLQAIGKLLRDSCRVYDVPGRYGGEEFCIVLPETKPGNTGRGGGADPQPPGRRRSFPCGETSIVVTASIGIAGMDCPRRTSFSAPRRSSTAPTARSIRRKTGDAIASNCGTMLSSRTLAKRPSTENHHR